MLACHSLDMGSSVCCVAIVLGSFAMTTTGLQVLKEAALALACVESRALMFLAAAVSDFFMPWHDMVKLCTRLPPSPFSS